MAHWRHGFRSDRVVAVTQEGLWLVLEPSGGVPVNFRLATLSRAGSAKGEHSAL